MVLQSLPQMFTGCLILPATHLALSLAGLCLWGLAGLALLYAAFEIVWTALRWKSATSKNQAILPSGRSTTVTYEEPIPSDWPNRATANWMLGKKASGD